MKSKSKEVQLKLSKSEASKLAKGSVPKIHTKAAQKAIRKIKKELKAHFKQGGWDLDYNHIKSDLLKAVFGTDLADFLIFSLIASGYTVKMKDSELLISKPSKRK